MVTIQRTQPVSEKIFAQNNFSQNKKSHIPSHVLLWSCFHRNENDAIERIGRMYQKCQKIWDKIPGKNDNEKHLYVFKLLVEKYNISPSDITKYFQLSNEKDDFQESIPRHIDTTKEKVGRVIKISRSQNTEYESRKARMPNTNKKPTPLAKKISPIAKKTIDYHPDIKQYFFIIEWRAANNLELDAFCERHPEISMISEFKKAHSRYPKDSAELMTFKQAIQET